jgi:hypothetical protein
VTRYIGLLTACFVVGVPAVAHGQSSNYSASVVTIYATLENQRIKQGSGFAVDAGIVTAYHVVQGAKQIRIVTARGEETTEVAVLAYNSPADLALVDAHLKTALRPLGLEDRLPRVDEDLFMVGSAAGLANSVYTVRPVRQELIPIAAFNDTRGKALLDRPPVLDVIQLAGVIYGGISGGPLLAKNNTVVALLSGSLAEGGSYGWAIPAKLILALTKGPKMPRTPEAIPWDAVSFRSASLRTTEYFVRRDNATEAQLSSFVQKSNRLSSINNDLEIKVSSIQSSLDNIAIGLQVRLEGGRLPGMGPVTVNEINNASQMYFQFQFGPLQNDLLALRQLLVERYQLDRELRQTTSKLAEIANRADLDDKTSRRVKRSTNKVTANYQDVAADTYERRQAVDGPKIIEALGRISGRSGLQFSSLTEVARVVEDMRFCSAGLQKYGTLSPFLNWAIDEQNYFRSARSILQLFQPLVVYVPD